jgi:uncharacterized protein (TIGR03437 family)
MRFLSSCFLWLGLVSLAHAQLSVVSSANQGAGVTADSLATIYGTNLASESVAAASIPWPTTLGDMPFVMIADSASHTQSAQLIYVSPNQMNIWIPAGTAPGPATLTFPTTGLPPGFGTAALRHADFTVRNVAPSLFSADGSGSGVAAATGVQLTLPTQFQGSVPVFQCAATGCTAIEINLGVDTPVYLSLYGTGIRGASASSNVMVTIGTVRIQPTYAGPQTQVPGLDQINVPLPLTLRGIGLTNVSVTVDGVTSNAVQLLIQ